MKVRVTDTPLTGVSSIMVSVDDIEIRKANTVEDSWIAIVEEERTFDLVGIQGAEVFLGEEEIEAGQYTQIRLEVTKVTVTFDGQESIC